MVYTWEKCVRAITQTYINISPFKTRELPSSWSYVEDTLVEKTFLLPQDAITTKWNTPRSKTKRVERVKLGKPFQSWDHFRLTLKRLKSQIIALVLLLSIFKMLPLPCPLKKFSNSFPDFHNGFPQKKHWV